MTSARMGCGLGRSGVAALELALVAPALVALLIASVDFGVALLSKARITEMLAASAAYSTLAGQNKVAQATITSNATTLAGSLTNSYLGTPTVTIVVNNGAAAGSTCCPGATWSCSTAANFTCADGSTPGTYMSISVSYPFLPLIAADAGLTGKTLRDRIVVALR